MISITVFHMLLIRHLHIEMDFLCECTESASSSETGENLVIHPGLVKIIPIYITRTYNIGVLNRLCWTHQHIPNVVVGIFKTKIIFIIPYTGVASLHVTKKYLLTPSDAAEANFGPHGILALLTSIGVDLLSHELCKNYWHLEQKSAHQFRQAITFVVSSGMITQQYNFIIVSSLKLFCHAVTFCCSSIVKGHSAIIPMTNVKADGCL